ncbi:MAG: zinc ribbon domain-containing protein [Planctomycetes bacterium]|nr:zinc ribbon domain-containing protein [Planctomycetota bacterium]
MTSPDQREPAEPSTPAAVPDQLPALPPDIFCPDCGYNLQTLTSNRCPECGFALDQIRAREPQIPWAHRRELGRFRAYWRTVGQVMLHDRRFCQEMVRPVSYSDAQRFRWITILHALAGLVFVALGELFIDSGPLEEAIDDFGAAIVPVLLVSVVLCLAALTGLPSYLFHPRHLPVEQQNRAVALSYYACAPLVWLFLAAVFYWPGLLTHRRTVYVDLGMAAMLGRAAALTGALMIALVSLRRSLPIRFGRLLRKPLWISAVTFFAVLGWLFAALTRSNADLTLIVLTAATLVATTLFWWVLLIRFARRLLRRTVRVSLVLIVVPLLWLAATLLLFGVPALILYAILLVYSLG